MLPGDNCLRPVSLARHGSRKTSPESNSRSNFNRLLFRQQRPWFYIFDLLTLNGRGLRGLPLLEDSFQFAQNAAIVALRRETAPRSPRD